MHENFTPALTDKPTHETAIREAFLSHAKVTQSKGNPEQMYEVAKRGYATFSKLNPKHVDLAKKHPNRDIIGIDFNDQPVFAEEKAPVKKLESKQKVEQSEADKFLADITKQAKSLKKNKISPDELIKLENRAGSLGVSQEKTFEKAHEKLLGSLSEEDYERYQVLDGERMTAAAKKLTAQKEDIVARARAANAEPTKAKTKPTTKADRLEKLRNAKPIEITGKEIEASDDLRQYKRNALEYGKNLRGEYTNKDTGRVVSLGANGVKEILNHDYKDVEHLQSIAAVPQIIENAIYIDTRTNEENNKNFAIDAYEYYLAGLKIGGVDYTVRAVVGIAKDGNRYYDHKLTKIEKGALLSLPSRITTPVGENNSPLSDIDDKRLVQILQDKDAKTAEKATGQSRPTTPVFEWLDKQPQWQDEVTDLIGKAKAKQQRIERELKKNPEKQAELNEKLAKVQKELRKYRNHLDDFPERPAQENAEVDDEYEDEDLFDTRIDPNVDRASLRTYLAELFKKTSHINRINGYPRNISYGGQWYNNKDKAFEILLNDDIDLPPFSDIDDIKTREAWEDGEQIDGVVVSIPMTKAEYHALIDQIARDNKEYLSYDEVDGSLYERTPESVQDVTAHTIADTLGKDSDDTVKTAVENGLKSLTADEQSAVKAAVREKLGKQRVTKQQIAEAVIDQSWREKLTGAVKKAVDKLYKVISAVIAVVSVATMTVPTDAHAQHGFSSYNGGTKIAGVSQKTSNTINWVVANKDHNGKVFMVADKANGVLHFVDKDGHVLYTTNALFGKGKGDSFAQNNTPSGRFILHRETNLNSTEKKIYGDSVLDLYDPTTGKQVQQDGGGIIAMHRLINKPERHKAINSATPEDNFISQGCINIPTALYNEVAEGIDGGMIYILEQEAPQLKFSTSHRGSHAAPTNDGFNARLDDLTSLYPADIYSDKAGHLYGHGGDMRAQDNAVAKKLQSMRGKPEMEVTVYRAVPSSAKADKLETGDWVTTERHYAETHGEHTLGGDYKIIEQKVKVKHLFTDANSLYELGVDFDDGIRYSASAMKSVEANIKRGREAMTKAILDKADVKRGMYNQEFGWVDFVWGDDGATKPLGRNGEPVGRGLAHIFEARQRKDGKSYQETSRMLVNDIVDTIAKGSIASRTQSRIVLEYKETPNDLGHKAILTKDKDYNSNAWILTAFENDPKKGRKANSEGETKMGYDKLSPTQNTATLSRDALGASEMQSHENATSVSNVAQAAEKSNKQDRKTADKNNLIPTDPIGGNIEQVKTKSIADLDTSADEAKLHNLLKQALGTYAQNVSFIPRSQFGKYPQYQVFKKHGVEGFYDPVSQHVFLVADGITAQDGLTAEERLAW